MGNYVSSETNDITNISATTNTHSVETILEKNDTLLVSPSNEDTENIIFSSPPTPPPLPNLLNLPIPQTQLFSSTPPLPSPPPPPLSPTPSPLSPISPLPISSLPPPPISSLPPPPHSLLISPPPSPKLNIQLPPLLPNQRALSTPPSSSPLIFPELRKPLTPPPSFIFNTPPLITSQSDITNIIETNTNLNNELNETNQYIFEKDIPTNNVKTVSSTEVQTIIDTEIFTDMINKYEDYDLLEDDLGVKDYYIDELKTNFNDLDFKFNLLNDDYERIYELNNKLENNIVSLNTQLNHYKKNNANLNQKITKIKKENTQLNFKKNYYAEQISELKMNHERLRNKYRIEILNLIQPTFPPKLRRCYSSS